MKNQLILAALALGMLMPAAGQQSGNEDVVARILETGKGDNRVMKHLDILNNRFGGRPIGSDAYDNAADWLMREFDRMGINCWKEEAGELPVGFNRGHWIGKLHAGEEGMTLHFGTPSYTSGTHGVQKGHVVSEPKTENQLKRMKQRLKGAWVLISGTNVNGWPIDKSAKGDSIRESVKAENVVIAHKNDSLSKENWEKKTNHEMIPYKEEPALFYKEMLDAGVLGFVKSSKVPIRALYDRTLLEDSTTNFDNLPTVPEIFLDEHQFAKIEQMVKERHDIELEFDIRNFFKLGPVKYHNIVAEIPGTEFPDEYVLVTGHLDAYDIATGGIDCGTGIGPMIEAARLLALSGAKPRRTIRFIAFAGEEFGLLGAKAYAKAHKDELPKISMMFNRDGGPLPPVGMRVPAAMKDDVEKATESIKLINEEYPFEIVEASPRVRPTKAGGTDASVFAIEGVPTYGFMENDFKGYDFNYGEIWHTERDLYNKHIPEYQEYTAVATALGALGIANLDSLLSREGMFIDADQNDTRNKKATKKRK